MFCNAYRFNQPLQRWHVDNVVDIQGMLSGALAFNQSLKNWSLNRAIDGTAMYHIDSMY
jgi:hypothetical protein